MVLSLLLIILNNFIFNNTYFIKNQIVLKSQNRLLNCRRLGFNFISNQKKRSTSKGLETYEFGTQSIGSITTISSNQFLILAILFLLFDIELIFLIPWCIGLPTLTSIPNLVIIIFIHCILYSLVIELKYNALNWYKATNLYYL